MRGLSRGRGKAHSADSTDVLLCEPRITRSSLSSLSGSVNFHRKFSIGWREELACRSGVYLRRWRIEAPLFSIRLHHWLHSDDTRSFHDHPWGFYTIILKGKYHDCSPADPNKIPFMKTNWDGSTYPYPIVMELMTPGKVRYRPAHHKHYVLVEPPGCWTILITGPKIRRWGFWVKEKFVVSYRYFYRYGSHPCD